MEFTDIKSVRIIPHRWDVLIQIVHNDDSTEEFIASADSYFTDNSAIYFGTASEYMEKLDNNV